MKHKPLLLALACALLAPLGARAEDEVSFEFFYDNLSPLGDWIEVGDYGTCWRPRDVDEEWAPYTDGYWSYTDAGWTWVSYEDFGDITYHYGRWVRANDVGWCWVPDNEWGPAWVSWRKSDDYIGWAPLPPEARWRSSVGFSVWVDDQYDIGPTYYNYCPTVEFSAPVIRHVCVPRARVIGLFGLTVNITNISYNSYNRHVFCGGPDYYYINRVCRQPVPALKLVQNTTIINNNVTIVNNRRVVRGPRNTVAGNTLQVFAPKVVNRGPTNIIKPQVTKVVPVAKVDKGWSGIKDPGEVKRYRDKVKNESKGLNPETAPAKPVVIGDLKPLPEKADPNAPSVLPGRPGGKPGKVPPIANKPTTLPADQPGKPITGGPTTLPAEKPGKPGRPGKPTTLPAETPGNPITGQPDRPDRHDRPGKPTTLPAEKPGNVVTDQPNRPDRPDKPSVMPTEKPGNVTIDQPDRPGRTGKTSKNGLKPFREPTTPPTSVQPPPSVRQPEVMPRPSIKKTDDDAAERIARQQQAAEGQRRMAEQAERQRAAAANAERMQKAQDDARRRSIESQRPAKPQQPDLSEQRARQAEAAQRQATMQRQAEAQQRAIQAQRQEAAQRQLQMQRQQPQPQPQNRGYQPQTGRAPAGKPMPQTQPQPSGGRGKALTPDQLEDLKKKQR